MIPIKCPENEKSKRNLERWTTQALLSAARTARLPYIPAGDPQNVEGEGVLVQCVRAHVYLCLSRRLTHVFFAFPHSSLLVGRKYNIARARTLSTVLGFESSSRIVTSLLVPSFLTSVVSSDVFSPLLTKSHCYSFERAVNIFFILMINEVIHQFNGFRYTTWRLLICTILPFFVWKYYDML